MYDKIGGNMRHNEIISTLQNLKNIKARQKDIAQATGLSINTVGNRAARNSNYSDEEVQMIGDYFQCDLFKLFYLDNMTANYAAAKENDFKTAVSDEDIIVDFYPDVFGSCGNGAFVLSETREKINVPKRCFSSFNQFKQYSVINAYGDSMLPYIHDKDKLIVEHWNGEQIRDNRVYVFRYGENIFVKRLVYNINQLVVKSDNTQYDTIKIESTQTEDLQIIGRIVGLMRDMD